MYTSLSIQNFRGIRTLEMNDFRRVNILTGKNNCGKTSVLEALYFLSRSDAPATGATFSIYRNIKTLNEDYWRSFFYDSEVPAKVIGNYRGENRSLMLKVYRAFGQSEDIISLLVINHELLNPDRVNGIIVEYTHQEIPFEFALTQTDEQKEFKVKELKRATTFPSVHSTLFISPTYLTDAPKRFSSLEINKEEAGITEVIKSIEPSINYIKFTNDLFYCDIGKERLLPLNVMGDGMVRMFSIILAIATTPGGAVLIDEIDTGFHYSTLEVMWKAVYAAAKQFDVQIFATTHSYECLRALSENLKQRNEDDSCLYRLDKREQEHQAVRFDQQEFVTSLEHFWEVR